MRINELYNKLIPVDRRRLDGIKIKCSRNIYTNVLILDHNLPPDSYQRRSTINKLTKKAKTTINALAVKNAAEILFAGQREIFLFGTFLYI